ncbi:MAG: DUF4129 domain-containing protein [Chitinophagaceae bacterium]|nr:DUF4129 domain-containing protein [Chitinophagaceae bacterium]
MYKCCLHILSIFLLCTIAAPCFAQDEDSIPAAVKDTIEQTLDSITKGLTDSSYNDEDEYYNKHDDTMYFLRKEDTTSIYDSSVFKWRAVPDSITEHLKNDDDFWYANKDLHEKKKQQSGSWLEKFLLWLARLLNNNVFSTILWILIILGFLSAVIWFLSKNHMNIWGSSKGPVISRTKQEGDVEDIFTTDLKTEIQKAEKNQDYRLAIRFHYLHLLKMFSQQELIKYTHDATNMEYLTQLYGKPFYAAFFKVTRNYEYAWYGEIAVTQEQYRNVVEEFMQVYNKTSISW